MARKIEYLNPKPHAIQISTPDKKIIKIRANEKIILSDWYMKHCPKYLRVVRIIESTPTIQPKKIETPYMPERLKKTQLNSKQRLKQAKAGIGTGNKERTRTHKPQAPHSQIPARIVETQNKRRSRKPVVGRQTRETGSKLYSIACQNNKYLISSNIGIGILSYNRLSSLKRLINSIRRNTDLRRVTVIVSDESDNPTVSQWLNKQTDIVVISNKNRLGVAGNTNRLLKCLSRFKYGIVLNDDVEVLQQGWETFYVKAYKQTNIHHFCYHQVGVYGAKRSGKLSTPALGWKVETINEKPHGAVMFYTNDMFNKIGYFDEQFGPYGMEHVDWSERAGKSGLQRAGYHDIVGSEKFFVIHQDKSSAPSRGPNLAAARKIYDQLKNVPGRLFIKADPKVPSISVIIPVRNIGRQKAVETVVNSIRGQLFPNIEIILAEQDERNKLKLSEIQPLKHSLVKSKYPDQPFTKAMAFNAGVASAKYDKVILQDGDIIVPSHYTEKIDKLLDKYDGVHIGSKVLYMSRLSSDEITKSGLVTKAQNCERAVEYFEGGSLACTKSAYFKIGAFNEIFEGYGVEDCDFFWRLKDFSSFYNTRSEDFVHLWHGRTRGWDNYHRKNKRIAEQIYSRYKPTNYVASLVAKMKRQYPALFRELNL